ncbi:MAG: hypothetical protein WA719_02895 [Thermoplasmata archaeon]
MEIKILEDRPNPLLKRHEYRFEVAHATAATPSRDSVRVELSKLVRAPKDRVIIERMAARYGTATTRGDALVYETTDAAKSITREHILVRNGLKEKTSATAAPAAEAPAAPSAAPEAPKSEAAPPEPPKEPASKAEPKAAVKPERKTDHHAESAGESKTESHKGGPKGDPKAEHPAESKSESHKGEHKPKVAKAEKEPAAEPTPSE